MNKKVLEIGDQLLKQFVEKQIKTAGLHLIVEVASGITENIAHRIAKGDFSDESEPIKEAAGVLFLRSEDKAGESYKIEYGVRFFIEPCGDFTILGSYAEIDVVKPEDVDRVEAEIANNENAIPTGKTETKNILMPELKKV